jgi:FkbM family methyltransferase
MKLYPFGTFILNIPDDHKIVEIHRDLVFYDRAYGLLLKEISQASPRGTIIDIGANVGDTAAFIASHVQNPIISVEGGETYAAYFKSNQGQFGEQVSLVEKFVRTDALARLSLNYAGANGTGAMSVSECGGIDEEKFISTDVLIKMAGREIALVKSDTDGMDGFIVSDFVDKTNAPVFFECDTVAVLPGVENPWPELFRKLQRGRYSVIVFDNFGLPMLIEPDNPERVLKDLSGYAHLQRGVNPIRIHYYDVWAFPPKWERVFYRIAAKLRDRLLRPYAF